MINIDRNGCSDDKGYRERERERERERKVRGASEYKEKHRGRERELNTEKKVRGESEYKEKRRERSVEGKRIQIETEREVHAGKENTNRNGERGPCREREHK